MEINITQLSGYDKISHIVHSNKDIYNWFIYRFEIINSLDDHRNFTKDIVFELIKNYSSNVVIILTIKGVKELVFDVQNSQFWFPVFENIEHRQLEKIKYYIHDLESNEHVYCDNIIVDCKNLY